MKKIFFFFLSLIMSIVSIFVSTSCSLEDNKIQPTSDEYFRFELKSDNTYEIESRYHDMPSVTVLPSTYQGKKVTAIAEQGFENITSIDQIIIPASIRTVGAKAFNNCTGLQAVVYQGKLNDWCNISFMGGSNPLLYAHDLIIDNVVITTGTLNIPIGLSYISDYSFVGCNKLTEIVLHSDIQHIGENAFNACDNLYSVYYEGNISSWCNITGLGNLVSSNRNIYINNQPMIDAFSGNIIIPNEIKRIGDYAFYNCSNLETITFPSSLISIGSYAFYGCSGLSEISFPSSLTGIGMHAFYGCSGLTEVTIPDTVTIYDASAFGNSLTSIKGSASNVSKIAKNSGISSVEITSGTEIKDTAFWGASSLTTITISNSITKIGDSAFHLCNKLKTIKFNGNFEEWSNIIGLKNLINEHNSARILYIGGTRLSGNVVVPEGLKIASEFMFGTCIEIVSLEFPNTLTDIRDCAFFYCYNLRTIMLPTSIKTINFKAFTSCHDVVINYAGTIDQWATVQKNNTYVVSNNNFRVHCLDGDISL